MINQLYLRDPVLTIVGGLHLVIFAATMILFLVDGRQILGINAWIKPMKFAISITIYLWTMAVLLSLLDIPTIMHRAISWTIAGTMLVEIVCIVMQSYRGVQSHFNITTAFDASIFSLMGTMIAINSVAVGVVLILFFTSAARMPTMVLWGIRLGIIVFLGGSAVGGQMVVELSHTVGAPDGGAGLPFVNWSTTAGDLRIAHFLGLHALQLFPLAALGLYHLDALPSTAKLTSFILFSTLYTAFVAWTYFQAMAGRPLVG